MERETLPLTSNEAELVEMKRLYPNNSSYTIGVVLHSNENYCLTRIKAALEYVHQSNSNLRACLQGDVKKITDCQANIEIKKTSGLCIEDVEEVFQASKLISFTLTQAPLYRIIYFDDSKHGSYTVIVASKFIMDVFSLVNYTRQYTSHYLSPAMTSQNDLAVIKKMAMEHQAAPYSFKPAAYLFQKNHREKSEYDAISHAFTYPLSDDFKVKFKYIFVNVVIQKALLDYFKQDKLVFKYMDKNRRSKESQPLIAFLSNGLPLEVEKHDSLTSLIHKNLEFIQQEIAGYVVFDKVLLKQKITKPVEICINYIPQVVSKAVNGMFKRVDVNSQKHMWADNVKLIISVFNCKDENIIELRALKAYVRPMDLMNIENAIVSCFSSQEVLELMAEKQGVS